MEEEGISSRASPKPESPRGEKPQRRGAPVSRAYVASRMGELSQSPHTLALLALLILTSVLLVILDVIADAFQRMPGFPSLPLVVTSNGLTVFALAVTVAMGTHILPHFHMFDPKEGGESFFAMQMGGYGLSLSAMVLKVLLVMEINRNQRHRYGGLTILSVAGVIGHTLLVSSFLFFVLPGKDGEEENSSTGLASNDSLSRLFRAISPSPQNAERRPYRDIVVVTLVFGGFLLSTSLSVSWSTSDVASGLHASTLISFVVCALIVIQGRGVVAHRRTPVETVEKVLYNVLRMPTKSLVGVVVQVWAHILLATALFALCRVSLFGSVDSGNVIVWRLYSSVAATVSIALHGLLLHDALRKYSISISAEDALLRRKSSFGGSPAEPLIITLTTFCVFTAVHILTVMAYSSGAYPLSEQISLERYQVSVVLQLQGMMALILFMMPPLTHFQGRLLHGRMFEIWNPFGGNVEFLVYQMASWMCYGSAALTLALHLSHPRRAHILFITTLLLLSQCGIHYSLRNFDPTKSHAASSAQPSKASLAKMTSVQRSSMVIRTVFNGEFILGAVLCGAGIVLRALCDVGEFIRTHPTLLGVHNDENQSNYISNATHSILHTANFLFILCVPMAQLSMRHHMRLFLDLDRRSTGYVLLIALGWTMYTSGLVAGTTQLLLHGRDASPSITTHGFTAYYMCEGLFFSFPLFCLTCGFFLEMHKMIRTSIREQKFHEVVEKLGAWVNDRVKDCSSNDRAELRRLMLQLEETAMVAKPAVAEPNTRQRDAEAVTDAAYYITILTSLVSTSIYIAAALLVDSGPIIPITFGFTGLLVVTLSCCNLQYSYGYRLHVEGGMGNSFYKYKFFMPFIGGKAYVLQQAIGWSAFTLCWFLMLASSIEGSPSAGNLLVLAVASALAQVFIMTSVGSFDSTKAAPDNFIARNPEGLLAAATIAGTFFCSRLYEASLAQRYGLVPEPGRILMNEGDAVSGMMHFAPSPVILSALSVIVAVPMGLMSLQRQAQQEMEVVTPGATPYMQPYGSGGFEDDEDNIGGSLDAKPMQNVIWQAFSPPGLRRDVVIGAAGEDGTLPIAHTSVKHHRKHRRRFFARSFSRILALLLIYLFPFIVFFLMYAYHLRLDAMFRFGVMALESAGVLFALLLALPIVIPVLLVSTRVSRFVCQVYYFACAWWMWSIPTMTVVGGLSPPFLVNTWGSWVWAGNMSLMSCFSTIPHLPFICFLSNTAILGFFLHHHFYMCWYAQRHPFHCWCCIGDLFAAALWVWYDTRYYGKPQINGRLYNKRVRNFFRNYVFSGAAHYFKIRVIRAEPYELEEEKAKGIAPESPVDRSDPTKQYLFSFHPHGVFPGSSLYVPCTSVWDDVIGCNDQNRITTHAADVIFLCPFMRELPLCVGALSVARRGIESSVGQGNSPLIITGGQSEMLLTKWSDTEMHLVCHHLGFIKLAMRHRLPLVPIISFSECNIMENIHWLRVQRWFVKRIGFPGVVLPHGFWYLPLPTHRPVSLVVGQPIRPYPGREDPDDAACVEEMRARYFNHLQTIFYKYRAEVGYPKMVLYLHNGIYDPGLRIPPPEECKMKQKEE